MNEDDYNEAYVNNIWEWIQNNCPDSDVYDEETDY